MSLRDPIQKSESVEVSTPEPKNPDIHSHTEGNLTPGVFESKTGQPYLTKVYNAQEAWSTFDHETQSNAELISEYFRELVDKGEFRSDDVAYRDYLKKYEKVTNTKDAPLQVKIKKMSEFIRYLKRSI